MSLKTVLAVGELVQAAAHIQGFTGPVEFKICRPPSDADLDRMADLYVDDDCEFCGEWNRCTCYDDDDDPDDYLIDDLYNQL